MRVLVAIRYLVAAPGLGGLADVPVAERGAAEHVDRPGSGPVGLAAPVALHQLGFLVLGEYALELDQQLVFGAVPRGPLANSTFVSARANSSISSAW